MADCGADNTPGSLHYVPIPKVELIKEKAGLGRILPRPTFWMQVTSLRVIRWYNLGSLQSEYPLNGIYGQQAWAVLMCAQTI